mmetsp:Transcript_18927/g.21376  ORF Transcript_18927/g.21376 Transcript_18927/m.21376 type:complete len:346 (-) Transcript_18927:62-1099(-)
MKYGKSKLGGGTKLLFLSLAFFCLVLVSNALNDTEPRFLEMRSQVKAAGGGGGDEAMTLHVHPPEASTEETMDGLKDLENLENKNRLDDNEDMLDQKKHLVEIQRIRVHDIVHGGFQAVTSLIPNPMKASIRKATRDIALDRGKKGFMFKDTQEGRVTSNREATTFQSNSDEKKKSTDDMFENYKFHQNNEFSAESLEDLIYNQVWEDKKLPSQNTALINLGDHQSPNYHNDTALRTAIDSLQDDISSLQADDPTAISHDEQDPRPTQERHSTLQPTTEMQYPQQEQVFPGYYNNGAGGYPWGGYGYGPVMTPGNGANPGAGGVGSSGEYQPWEGEREIIDDRES